MLVPGETVLAWRQAPLPTCVPHDRTPVCEAHRDSDHQEMTSAMQLSALPPLDSRPVSHVVLRCRNRKKHARFNKALDELLSPHCLDIQRRNPNLPTSYQRVKVLL